MDVCGFLHTFLSGGIPGTACRPGGIFLVIIAGLAALATGALVANFKDWIKGQAAATILFVLAVLVIAYFVSTASSMFQGWPAVLLGAVPIAVFFVFFGPLSKKELALPRFGPMRSLSIPAHKFVVSLSPLFLVLGGLAYSYFGPTPNAAVFVAPADQTAAADVDKDLPGRVFNSLSKELKDAWSNSVIDVWPRELASYSGFYQAFASTPLTEYDRFFAQYGAPVPVKYSVSAIITKKSNGWAVQPYVKVYRADARRYKGDNWGLPLSVGPQEATPLLALISGYHFSKALLERECSTPPPSEGMSCDAEKRKDAEAQVSEFASEHLLDELLRFSGQFTGGLAETVSQRQACSDLACVDKLVDLVTAWLNPRVNNKTDSLRSTTAVIAPVGESRALSQLQ